MEMYRILISDFDEELKTIEASWVGRKFRLEWVFTDPGSVDMMVHYLSALSVNTRKPIDICLALAAKYAFPDASIEVMTPEDIAKVDAIPTCVFATADAASE